MTGTTADLAQSNVYGHQAAALDTYAEVQFGGKKKATKAKKIPKSTSGCASKKRSFKIVSVNGKHVNHTGTYKGDPGSAAKKALGRLAKDNKKACDWSVKFIIREKTQGSLHKEFKYSGKQTKLRTPITYKIGKNIITVKFARDVKAV
jgi:hypothetical protein